MIFKSKANLAAFARDLLVIMLKMPLAGEDDGGAVTVGGGDLVGVFD